MANAPSAGARNVIKNPAYFFAFNPPATSYANGKYTLNSPHGANVQIILINPPLYDDSVARFAVHAEAPGADQINFRVQGNGNLLNEVFYPGDGDRTFQVDITADDLPLYISADANSNDVPLVVEITPLPLSSEILKCVDGAHVPVEEGDTLPPEFADVKRFIKAGENISLTPLPGGKILISNLCCPDAPVGTVRFEADDEQGGK